MVGLAAFDPPYGNTMRVTVQYMAQLKRAAGLGSELVEVDPGCTVAGLLLQLAQRKEEAFRAMVLDRNGGLQPSLLVFVGEEQRRSDSDEPLPEGACVTLLTPMAGG